MEVHQAYVCTCTAINFPCVFPVYFAIYVSVYFSQEGLHGDIITDDSNADLFFTSMMRFWSKAAFIVRTGLPASLPTWQPWGLYNKTTQKAQQ